MGRRYTKQQIEEQNKIIEQQQTLLTRITKNMMNISKAKLLFGGLCCLSFMILYVTIVEVATIQGNQLGVVEHWIDGVSNEPLQPRTYVFFPGFMYTVYKYDMSPQVFVMNEKPESDKEYGRDVDSYLVQSKEGQDMHISLNVVWRLSPDHIIDLHKVTHDKFEERFLRPALMRAVKDEATRMEAIEAYSGEGLVALQQKIDDALKNDKELLDRGIIIDNFVIENIRLDENYVQEIKQKQVAVQRELRAVQEEKAALAEAKKARAEAQSDLERKVVEAERDKQVGVLKAEQEAEVAILAAEADKQKKVLEAEAEKESGDLKASAILALGTAEAEAQKLRLAAYAVEGSDSFVKIEVAKSMATAFQNIRGYLPENMHISVLSESFNKGLSVIVDPQQNK